MFGKGITNNRVEGHLRLFAKINSTLQCDLAILKLQCNDDINRVSSCRHEGKNINTASAGA